MRISDWSSDVCSSVLGGRGAAARCRRVEPGAGDAAGKPAAAAVHQPRRSRTLLSAAAGRARGPLGRIRRADRAGMGGRIRISGPRGQPEKEEERGGGKEGGRTGRTGGGAESLN